MVRSVHITGNRGIRWRQSRKRYGSRQLVGVRCNWCGGGGNCGKGRASELSGTGAVFRYNP
nr:hypothetical protein [Escherichia coli]